MPRTSDRMSCIVHGHTSSVGHDLREIEEWYGVRVLTVQMYSTSAAIQWRISFLSK